MSSEPVAKTGRPGRVFWFFGLSGAGKSTLANALTVVLRSEGRPVLSLDGDVLRNGLCQGLGFSESDRTENLRRAAETARLGSKSSLTVVASFITPLISHRRLVTEIIGPEVLSMIHVFASLDVCRSRDVKGLYARAASGQIQQMTGLSSAFEQSGPVDLIIPTDHEDVATSTRRLLDYARGLLAEDRV